ncbi:MAG: VWA domain-containing protein [Acidobacteriota bacterium]
MKISSPARWTSLAACGALFCTSLLCLTGCAPHHLLTSAVPSSSFAPSGLTAQPIAEPAAEPQQQQVTPAPQQQAAPAPAPAAAPAATPDQNPQQTPDPSGQAQQGDEQLPGNIPTITRYVNEVDLVFTVTGKNGQFVTGLRQQDFGLLDDGRPPEKVNRFVQQTNLPLRVGIMLDTSTSIRQRFQFEQQAAIDFLLQVLHPADRAFVEGFDVQTQISQDFTNRIDLLDTGIRNLRPGGGTALFDSLYKTCQNQMLALKQPFAVRKAIVLVSDGDDDYSRALESDAIKMCQRAQTTIYTISTNTGPSRDKGDDVLKQISDATGGQAFYPTRMEDVAQGFHNIEEELRSQYLLVYTPAEFKRDGAFRTIYLQALDPRYSVRAEKGYFAPKAEQ